MPTKKTVFIIPDVHFPHHDRKLFRLTLRAIAEIQPDEIVFIGDLFDFAQVSRYPHNAYKLTTIQETVKAGQKAIVKPVFSETSEAKKTFIMGNHEDRIRRYAELHFAPFGGTVVKDVLGMLSLEAFDKVVGYEEFYSVGSNTAITHGSAVRSFPGHSVRQHMEYFNGMNVIMGHTHRIGSYQIRTHDGYRQGFEIGHLTNSKDVPGWRPMMNWHASPGTVLTLNGKSVDIHVLRESRGRVVLPGATIS